MSGAQGKGNLLSELGLEVHSATFAFLQGHVLMPPSLESPPSAPHTLQEGSCASPSLNGQGLLTCPLHHWPVCPVSTGTRTACS